jgi:hypothetical protein
LSYDIRITLNLVYAGPSSGFAVLSQATELLNNGKAIHQELHMSEFDSSGKEVQVGSDISLPPKDIANKYIEGEFIPNQEVSVSSKP